MDSEYFLYTLDVSKCFLPLSILLFKNRLFYLEKPFEWHCVDNIFHNYDYLLT